MESVPQPQNWWRDIDGCAAAHITERMVALRPKAATVINGAFSTMGCAVRPEHYDLSRGSLVIARPVRTAAQGEFRRSSQHLISEELQWGIRMVSELFGPCALGCALPVIHRAGVASTSSGSGRRSHMGCPVRTPRWRPASRPRSGTVGSGKVGVCEQSAPPSCQAATSLSPSERRSPSSEFRAAAFARWLAGPDGRWIGRRHGRRQDRRWAKSWSPEQISNRLCVDFPDDESMRISHEAIYQALYVQGRGALRRERTACLRTGRALRVPRARTQVTGKNFVTPEVMISERPAEAADRAAIGSLVERTTRFTMLLYLPRMQGYGSEPRVKNGPGRILASVATPMRLGSCDGSSRTKARVR